MSQEINSKAFNSNTTEYYELQIDLGQVKKGTIFYYDPNDSKRGSIMKGCLKLAWRKDGGCQYGYAGDAIVFHADYREDETMFKRIEKHYDRQTSSRRKDIVDSIINSLIELKSTF